MTKYLALGFALVWVGLPAASQVPPLPTNLPTTLDLDQAVEIALSRHGQLDAARAAVDARRGATQQAGLSPNPVFSLQTENWRFYGDPGFSASGDLDVFALISLPIETAGKKQRRISVAELDQRIAEIEGDAAAFGVRQNVKRAYWEALAAQARVEMLSSGRATLRQLEQYHEVRVKLGAMAEVDLIKVRVEVGRLALTSAEAGLALTRARIALLEAMGISEPDANFELRQPKAKPVPASWNGGQVVGDIAASALEHRSEILLSQAHLERARAAVQLQRSLGRPDVTPYLGYKRSNSFHTLVGGLSIPLPVRNKNSGAIEEALAEVRRQEATLRAVETRVRSEVAAALETVRQRSAMLQSMESGMLERARETARIATAAYQEGGLELLDVLDAQRAQNEIGLLYSRLFFDQQLSWVELESVAGTASLPLPAVSTQAAAAPTRMPLK